jgi:hypothetical protein
LHFCRFATKSQRFSAIHRKREFGIRFNNMPPKAARTTFGRKNSPAPVQAALPQRRRSARGRSGDIDIHPGIWVALACVAAFAGLMSLSGGQSAPRANGPLVKELPFESRQVNWRRS